MNNEKLKEKRNITVLRKRGKFRLPWKKGNRRCQFLKAGRRNKDHNIGKEVFAASYKTGPKVEETSKTVTALGVRRNNAQGSEVRSVVFYVSRG